MATKVHGLHPWDKISRVSKLQGPRYAAIAFIGVDAPDMLALQEGDVLVCNAGQIAVEAGATNPHALREFVDRGVAVFNCESLHAKLLAVKNSAAVGSANASRNSRLSLEAVVVSNERAFISEVRKLVKESIKYGSEVSEEYLETAIGWLPEKFRSAPVVVGVTAPPSREDVFIPEPGGTFWLDVERKESYTENEDKVANSMKRWTRAKQFETKYEVDTYLVAGKTQAVPGDVFILLHENDEGQLELVWEPAKIIGARPVTEEDSSTMYLLRYNRGFQENSMDDIDYAMDQIRQVAGVDIGRRKSGAKAIQLSEQQGENLIAKFWG